MSGSRHAGWVSGTAVAVILAIAGCGENQLDPVLIVHTDAALVPYEGSVYLISRSGVDNLMRLAPSPAPSIICYLSDFQSEAGLVSVDLSTRTVTLLRASSMVYEAPLGSNVNAQHIGFVSSAKAYVAQYGSSQLLIVNPQDGTTTGMIDLSAFGLYAGTDSAGLPRMGKTAVDGSRCYVACQRLNSSYAPVVNGVLAVIDIASDSVVDSIPLSAMNPSDMHVSNGKLYVSQTGLWTNDLYETVLDGGIECIDPAGVTSEGMVLLETVAGGNISTFVMVSATKAYVTIARPDWTNAVIEFNPSTGTVTDTVGAVGSAGGTLLYEGGLLYIADRGAGQESIMVIDPSTNAMVGQRIPLDLPPGDIAM